MCLRDGTKNNVFKGQYKEQWVQGTLQRPMSLRDSRKNNEFKGQYKEQWV